MKRKRLVPVILLALTCILCTVFAFGCSDKAVYYTVTFMDGQTQIGEPVKVQKGKKIAEYPTAARADENYVFDGWFKDEELEKVWNHDIERVTKDITLWASFLYVPATPSNVAMDGGAFSNTVTWLQRNITADTDFTVEIVGTDIVSGGKDEFVFESYKGHNDIYTVKWTPAQKPLGGVYSARITSGTADGITADNLMFKGAGTAVNPYLLTSSDDLAEINANDVAAGGYFKLAQSFTARLSANDVYGKVFNGNLNGNGKTVTLEASDIGLFGILGENSEVKDLTVAGAVANVRTDCVGAIAGVNRGKISYCTVSASLDSAVGTVGTLTGDKDGIEGGIAGVAGINYGEITCCTYSGTVKSNVGGAGVTVINNGDVSLCSFTGTIGAANSVETGNSTKAYSYIGGIAAINYSVIEKSSTDGSGKLLAQRGEGGLNDYVGGIVALNQNGAAVSECWFDGIRVHGNKNVGGIAGANSGTIIYCYAGGDYHSGSKNHSYVGGLSEVGGITGLLQNGGSVSNCFVTSNVYAYSGNAYKVAQTSSNSIYAGGNLDNRSGTVTVKADESNGNIKIELSGDFASKNYPLVLTDEQLTALNGSGSAFTDKTNVRLVCEGESTVIEHSITVIIDGKEIGTVSSVSGNSILLKDYVPTEIPASHYFAGWAVSQNGEAVFAENAQVNYASLEKYGLDRITLYPVLIEGEKPQSKVLNVAVYARYVNEDIIKDLLEKFKASSLFAGFEDVHYTLVGDDKSNNAAFQAGVAEGNGYGAYNIAIGFRNALDVGQSQTLDLRILNKAGEALETRQVGLIGSDNVVVAFGEFLATDTAKKIMNPSYVSEAEADKIIVTLMNGGVQYGEKFTVSNATEAVAVTLPTVEGGNFAGWAVTETAADGETLLNGSKGYADLAPFATDNALTLYARFTETPQKPSVVVAIHSSASSTTYITQEEIEKIKSGFVSYLTSKGYADTDYDIEWYVVTGKNASEFDSAVADYGKTVNVAVGGNAMGLAFDATYGKTAVKSGMFANTSRKVGMLSGSKDNELAVLFYQYMTVAETA